VRGRRAGFGVLEALIALTILTLIIGAILSYYTKAQQTFINESAESDALEQTRAPLDWMARDVKLATGIDETWGGYTTSSDTLILSVPSIDTGGLIIDAAAHSDRIIYRVESGRLLRITDAKDGVSARVDRTRILAVGVALLSVGYADSNGAVLSSGFGSAASVQPALTVWRDGFQRAFSESLRTNVKLRNR
jgi:type II secretory pathway component PulJ